MNYIKSLQKRIKEVNSNISKAREELYTLQTYLSSSKFNCGDELDQYVNIQDVFSRIEKIKEYLHEV